MQEFFAIALSLPTLFFSCLLLIVCLYWILACVGLLDLDAFSIDADGLETIAGLLHKLGWDNIPMMIVLSPLIFFSWIFSFLGEYVLLTSMSIMWVKITLGFAIFIASLLLSVPLTGAIVKRLKPLFIEANPYQEAQQWIGRTAHVRSSVVNENFGEAYLALGSDAKKIIEVRSWSGSEFSQGDSLILVEYLPKEHYFKVVSVAEFDANDAANKQA